MMKTRRMGAAIVILALLTIGVLPTLADEIDVQVTSAAWTQYRIGAGPEFNYYDVLTVSEQYQTLTLTRNVPRIAAINPFTFEAGPNNYGSPLVPGDTPPWDLSVQTMDMPLPTKLQIQQPWSVQIGSTQDQLTFFNGASVYFSLGTAGFVKVTPQGQPSFLAPPTYHGWLSAEFVWTSDPPPLAASSVPLPSVAFSAVVILAGLGVARVAGSRKKFRA